MEATDPNRPRALRQVRQPDSHHSAVGSRPHRRPHELDGTGVPTLQPGPPPVRSHASGAPEVIRLPERLPTHLTRGERHGSTYPLRLPNEDVHH